VMLISSNTLAADYYVTDGAYFNVTLPAGANGTAAGSKRLYTTEQSLGHISSTLSSYTFQETKFRTSVLPVRGNFSFQISAGTSLDYYNTSHGDFYSTFQDVDKLIGSSKQKTELMDTTINSTQTFQSHNSAYVFYGDVLPDGTRFIFQEEKITKYTGVTDDAFLNQASDWLKSFSTDPVGATLKSLRNIVESESVHAEPLYNQIKKYTTHGGVRGSGTFDGFNVFTNSPGVATFDVTLGDSDSLSIPLAFGDNKDDAQLEIFFDDVLLSTFDGADFGTDIEAITLAVNEFKNTSGKMKFVLNTSGSESANLFIADDLSSLSAVPIPAAAWLFGSALLGLGVMKRKRA
jgi:hypothetical protein